MRTIALRLAYDGTAFAGSQWQANGRTVQGELEAAWERLTQEQRRWTLSGRTDAGVHATGQVAHLSSATHHSIETIQRALNALLPDDLRVLAAWEAEADFHARFSARWRHYRYLLDPSPVALPLLRHTVYHIGHRLDVAAMQAALALLEGEHDFAAFAALQGYSGSTIRRCYTAQCTPITMLDRALLAIELVANGFLRHMVRTIVGTVVLVGEGRLREEAFGCILTGRDRKQAGPTAAAHGLTLVAVGYAADPLPFGRVDTSAVSREQLSCEE
ncbi:MAG: tRNA pseudouridine(38-40) synthase TruA [Chloroflexaceae bacterium]|nr:tRNA pseudouridine(38-40) synthase TruA [Chloroflexaceae bacterium]